MNIKDGVNTQGTFRIRIYKSGRFLWEETDHNLVVDAARSQLARLVSGDSAGRRIHRIAFGTSGNQAQVGDTEITEPFIKEVDSVDYPSGTQVKFNWTVATGEANGKAIMEFGLLCEDGTLFARYVRQTPLNKDSDFSLEGDWTIEF